MFAANTNLLPESIIWDNYVTLLSGTRKGDMYFKALANSMRAVGITIVIGIPVAMMSAYALSKLQFKGRTLVKNMLLITMVIPVMATIIPLYKMFAAGKMLDNMFWLSLVYVSSYLPMATWMITNYFSTIPKELEESAMIDGCSKLSAFFRITLRLSYPIILSVMLIMFLNTWSQFQIPLILASSMDLRTTEMVIYLS